MSLLLNRGGALSMDYFVAYMALIINTMGCSAEEAKKLAFDRLFRGNEDTLGKESYQRFLQAYEVIKKRKTKAR
jgi:hypothetical protein